MMSHENEGFDEVPLFTPLEKTHHNDGKNKKSSSSNGDSNGRDDNQHPRPLSSPVSYAEILTSGNSNPLLRSSPSHRIPNSFNSSDGDRGNQINRDGAVSSSSPSTSSDYLNISVTDPRKELDPTSSAVAVGKTYRTYLITTWTNLPEFNGTEFSVRRRFRDVVWLSDQLSDSYRGFFIPTRPDKGVFEKQLMKSAEFIEQRRIDLDKYLRKLAGHPVIRKSEELRVFLQVQGKLPLMKTNVVGEGDLVKMFKELRQSVTYGWGGTKPPLVVEEDKDFMEKKMKLQGLEVQLNNVALRAESFVKAQQDIEETMRELGFVFVNLTQLETEKAVYESQKIRAGVFKNVSSSAVKASRLYRELNTQTIRHLDKLHNYLGVMLDANNAFSDRSNALLRVQTLVSEISTLNSRIEKLEANAFKVFGGERSRIQKLDDLKESVRVANNSKISAVRMYENIKKNNKTEFVRIDKERREDFFGMLKGFVANQAVYAEKMASAWDTLANETSTDYMLKIRCHMSQMGYAANYR